MAEHHFHLQADWPPGRNSTGILVTDGLRTEISIPEAMDGPGNGTNPDEMLLGAATTCYIITLAAMLERSGISPKKLSINSEAVVDVSNGIFTYQKIIHRPHIVLAANEDRTVSLVRRLAEKAEHSCMISRAVKGNVAIELEASITAETD